MATDFDPSVPTPIGPNTDLILSELKGDMRVLMTSMRHVESDLVAIKATQKENNTRLERHAEAMATAHEEMRDSFFTAIEEVENKVLSSFPNQDTLAHNAFHTNIINATKVKKERVDTVITDILKNAAWAALAALAVFIWTNFAGKIFA
jgi:transcription termination factor NusB